MHPGIRVTRRYEAGISTVCVVTDPAQIPDGILNGKEQEFVLNQLNDPAKDYVSINRFDFLLFVVLAKNHEEPGFYLEKCRKAGDRVQSLLNEHHQKKVIVYDACNRPEAAMALAEGISLGSYRFLRYKTKDEKPVALREILIFSEGVKDKDVRVLNAVIEGVWFARTMVNEPNSWLSAPVFGKEIEKEAASAGLKCEIFNKKKLESLHMGGILGVNQGSAEPPLLITLEWKPGLKKLPPPVVLVGKGVMFDTGGMNLKPGDYMNNMKGDMAGGAAVAGAMIAIARAGLPLHVIGLIPATDNRPGVKGLVSGDVITMHNGMTVEVINTDAEGRLILADALSFARKYKPSLVIDLATLTGSASRAIGQYAMVGMQSKAREFMEQLISAGFRVYERVVEFPLWDDYGEMLKSEIADIKNLGGSDAGAITAGKFLEKFTDYPYIHLDIAGPAFLEKRDSYRGIGGSGNGVRLLLEFLRSSELRTIERTRKKAS